MHRRVSSDPPVIVVWGATRLELFENAGRALFEEGHELHQVAPTYSRPIVAPGDSYEELLENWLEELVFVSRREGIVWSYFVVDRLEEGGVQGSASGLPEGQVMRTGRRAESVALTPTGLVQVPEGWWTELRITLEP